MSFVSRSSLTPEDGVSVAQRRVLCKMAKKCRGHKTDVTFMREKQRDGREETMELEY